MSTESELEAIAPIVLPMLYQLVKDIEAGTIKPLDVARRIVGIGEQVVPYDDLKLYLTEGGRAHGELLADIASDEKFTDENGDPE